MESPWFLQACAILDTKGGSSMKVLVVGRGGREHALCEKISASPRVREVYVAPGNPGMMDVATLLPYKEDDHEALVKFCHDRKIDLVIIGPEKPLVEGLTDRLAQDGICVFAPSQGAARIEGSKSYAKELMGKHHIPTGKYRIFCDFDLACDYVRNSPLPIVIKADGLAAGKGVVVAFTQAEAIGALRGMLVEQSFGEASSTVIVEEFLEGEEFSLMALVQGELVVPLDVAQDHKRAFDGDLGPNTGGMGAYSPVPQIPPTAVEEAITTILEPTARALVQEGTPFTGVLYAGLMLTREGPKVIEFNARFGDPETQVLLPRLESDLVEAMEKVLEGKRPKLKWSTKAMVGVVVASKGYPEAYTDGILLPTYESEGETRLYYSGVDQNSKGQLLSSGGRVYLLASLGDSLQEAKGRVYTLLERHNAATMDTMHYRTDIGHRALP